MLLWSPQSMFWTFFAQILLKLEYYFHVQWDQVSCIGRTYCKLKIIHVLPDLKDHEISINYTDSQSMSSFSYSWFLYLFVDWKSQLEDDELEAAYPGKHVSSEHMRNLVALYDLFCLSEVNIFETQLSISHFAACTFWVLDTWWGKNSCIRRCLLIYPYHNLEHQMSLEGKIALLSMCKDALSILASRINLQEWRSLS